MEVSNLFQGKIKDTKTLKKLLDSTRLDVRKECLQHFNPLSFSELYTLSFHIKEDVRQWAFKKLYDGIETYNIKELNQLTRYHNDDIKQKSISVLQNHFKKMSLSELMNVFENNDGGFIALDYFRIKSTL